MKVVLIVYQLTHRFRLRGEGGRGARSRRGNGRRKRVRREKKRTRRENKTDEYNEEEREGTISKWTEE